MTKGLPRSLARAKDSDAAVKRLRLRKTVEITITGATGVGYGSAVLAGLPEANILVLGAVAYVTVTGKTNSDVADAFDGDFGIGSTPADNGTITGTDVDIIASTALPQASGGVVARTRATNVTTAVIDNTAGTGEINLSILVDDADVSGDTSVLTVYAELDLIYSVLNDD